MKKQHRITHTLMLLGLAATALAQIPGGQINPQVNNELYGGGVPSSVRYSQTSHMNNPLPSEWRYAARASGSLPSDIKMNYNAMGPMAEGGPMAYINNTPTYAPSPNKAPPSAMGHSAYGGNNISSYSSPGAGSSGAAMSQGPRNAQMSAPSLSQGPMNASMRYSR